jgi:hypothetical protein
MKKKSILIGLLQFMHEHQSQCWSYVKYHLENIGTRLSTLVSPLLRTPLNKPNTDDVDISREEHHGTISLLTVVTNWTT